MFAPQEYPKFPQLSFREKMEIFNSLPIVAQKILIALSAYAASVGQALLSQIRETMVVDKKLASTAEFDQGIAALLKTPYFSKTGDQKTGVRFEVAAEMKTFIMNDMRRHREEQKQA